MIVEEYVAKPLLAAAGIKVPPGKLCFDAGDVKEAAAAIGPCLIKAQIPTGRAGSADGIRLAETPGQAEDAARGILGMIIGDHKVEKALVEAEQPVARTFYAAVVNHQETKGPLLLFSTKGGMEIGQIARDYPDDMAHLPVDIRDGVDDELLEHIFGVLELDQEKEALVEFFLKLYDAYRVSDANMIEVNPLAFTGNGELVALDCRFTLDDSAVPRRPELAALGAPDKLTELEARAKALDLNYIELEGDIGVLANGAGLAMAAMDAIRHHGGEPANYLDIGGDAYTLGRPALEIVLANPKVRRLLISLSGAFARTDVMASGLLEAWAELEPDMPVAISIHGTGADQAIAMVKEKLGIDPFDLIDDAVKTAVEAAR